MQGLRSGIADDDTPRRPVPPPQRRDTRPVGPLSSLERYRRSARRYRPFAGLRRRQHRLRLHQHEAARDPPQRRRRKNSAEQLVAAAVDRALGCRRSDQRSRHRRAKAADGGTRAPTALHAGAHSRWHARRHYRRNGKCEPLSPGAGTLLRRRTAVEEDAFAQLGLRCRRVHGVARSRDHRWLRYQSRRACPGARFLAASTVAPELLAKSDWERHEITANLRGSYTAYGQTPELDRPTFDGKIAGRLDVTRDTSLLGEGTLVVGTDNPGSPNVQAGLSRFPIFTTIGGSARHWPALQPRRGHGEGHGGAHRVSGLAFHRRHHRDQSRSRLQSLRRHWCGRSYDLMPGIKPFVEGGYDTREHDLAIRPLRHRARLDRLDTERRHDVRVLAQADRRIRARLDRTQLQGPDAAAAQGLLVRRLADLRMSALTNVKLTAQTVAARNHRARHGRHIHPQRRRRGRARVPPLADRFGEVQLRLTTITSARLARTIATRFRARSPTSSTGRSGQGRGARGVAALVGERRRLQRVGLPARNAPTALGPVLTGRGGHLSSAKRGNCAAVRISAQGPEADIHAGG